MNDVDYQTLSLSPLLVGLNMDELESLVGAAAVHQFRDGTVIVQEGEPGESMYILHDGEVVIEKKTGDGNHVELTRLHRRGDFFGEMVFVDVLPRSATVRADPEAMLLEFPLETLAALLRSSSRRPPEHGAEHDARAVQTPQSGERTDRIPEKGRAGGRGVIRQS